MSSASFLKASAHSLFLYRSLVLQLSGIMLDLEQNFRKLMSADESVHEKEKSSPIKDLGILANSENSSKKSSFIFAWKSLRF